MNESAAIAEPTLRARATLSLARRDEMFALLARHFDGATREQFESDLAAKDWVIELNREGRVFGFTTLRVATSLLEGVPVTVLYSGDTIVAPEAWGTPALARAWIAGVNRIKAGLPGRRCFWLLLTSGFRTYRFLPVFWREFFPRFDQETPLTLQRLLAQLAREGYGRLFDPASGVVRFANPQRLRGPLAAIPVWREANPHIAFFLRRNPGHVRGDELVCLTEICAGNLTAAGRRMVTPPAH